MTTDKIQVTTAMVEEALGNARFKLSIGERTALATALTKRLTPPIWRVEEVVDENGAKTPVVRYKDNLVTLTVYTGIARPDLDRRRQAAEVVAGVLNDREVEV